ncbi:hypothetical protein [Rhabdochromatium marinum]|nr:hypothetical protein [Rhabdochromatium marinum]
MNLSLSIMTFLFSGREIIAFRQVTAPSQVRILVRQKLLVFIEHEDFKRR